MWMINVSQRKNDISNGGSIVNQAVCSDIPRMSKPSSSSKVASKKEMQIGFF
jgi:hypothetical protein